MRDKRLRPSPTNVTKDVTPVNIKNNLKRVVEFLATRNINIAEAIESHYLKYIDDNMMLVTSGRKFSSCLTNNAKLMPVGYNNIDEVYAFCIFTDSLAGDDCDIVDSTVINVTECTIDYGAQFQPTKH